MLRFLGIDAPEISFTLPGAKGFTGLDNPKWEEFLSDPLTGLDLSPGLSSYLRQKVGAGAAQNHYRHAQAVHRALEQEVMNDMDEQGLLKEEFKFFMAFAHEVMDRYGRLLGFINRDPPEGDRPQDYNGRLLRAGMVSPYFIWPNINPYRKAGSITQAVIKPGDARITAEGDRTLRDARGWVESARDRGWGVFDSEDPLRLEPFEVRFLAGRRPPNRYVIDLKGDDDVLILPQEYYTVPHAEDRLFIPEEYVPLFREAG